MLFSATFLLFTSLVPILAAPTQSAAELAAVFDRAVGDTCKGSEGSGTCKSTASCKGISYTGLCPKDPTDIKCCVEIACSQGSDSGFCRSVSNNGCSGGSFLTGLCPGDSDIKCCVKDSASPPPPSSDTLTWTECKQKLSCTFEQIEGRSMADRLAYVRYMQDSKFGSLNSGNQLRAIEGVITFFEDNGLGKPKTWASITDAGIVQGVQNGGGMALGYHSITGGNPGSDLWKKFFLQMKNGGYSSRASHDKAWSEAEQASTEFGKGKADASVHSTLQENLWYLATQLFRWVMRHRSAVSTFFVSAYPLEGLAAETFVNWLTDITDIKPTLCFSKAVWDIVGLTPDFDIIALVADAVRMVKIVYQVGKCFHAR